MRFMVVPPAAWAALCWKQTMRSGANGTSPCLGIRRRGPRARGRIPSDRTHERRAGRLGGDAEAKESQVIRYPIRAEGGLAEVLGDVTGQQQAHKRDDVA